MAVDEDENYYGLRFDGVRRLYGEDAPAREGGDGGGGDGGGDGCGDGEGWAAHCDTAQYSHRWAESVV